MYEVEVKVPADLATIRRRLDALGAERIDAVEQFDTYYDAPHREFAETDEALRIREETPDYGASVTNVTYKGPLVEAESKTREEFETAVEDRDAMEGILDGLGFEPAAVVRKNREFYTVDEYSVTLDDVADVGEYVEVERGAVQANVEAAREGALDVLSKLQLDPDDQVRASYLELKSMER